MIGAKKMEGTLPDKVVTSIYLTKDTLKAIDKMADRNGIARTEQIRQFIDEGLSVESYSDNLQMITDVISQALAIQIKGLGNRLAGLINRLTIISAAGYYANIAIISDLIDRDRYSSFEKIEQIAESVKDFQPDVVAGMGGGKTMDTAKAVADIFKAATIIIPTTASTDAPVIARKKALAYANQKNADALVAFMDDEEMKKAIRAVMGGGASVDPDV